MGRNILKKLFQRGFGADLQHEVLFEQDITSLRGRQLFVGGSFARKRFIASSGFAVMILIALLSRAGWMQVVQGKDYRAKAENNRLRKESLFARRGIIKDRNGVVLAENIPRFQVAFTPSRLPLDKQAADDMIGRAARVLGISINDIQPYAEANSSVFDETVVVAEEVGYEQSLAFAIEQPNLPAFELQVAARRKYPESGEIESLSHLLGYAGIITQKELDVLKVDGYSRVDTIGKTGLEKAYESLLKGEKGFRTSEVDARGRAGVLVGEQAAIDGADLELSLDTRLQKVAEDSLKEWLATAKAERGAVIALDPRDGSVLALVSWPAYDNNLFSGKVSSTVYSALLTNENRPLFARAWQGSHPSGSTAKIIVATAALAEQIVTPNTTVLSTGGIRIGQWFFPDWKAGGHGVVNVRGAIANSVNTFFYTVGGGYGTITGLGVDKMTDWMRRFGLSEKTGIDLTGEDEGFVPSQEWKLEKKNERWYVGDTYNLSIGQGDLLVTPIQVAAYTAAIANGGYRVTPHLKRDTGTETLSKERIANEDIINTVRAGMRDCVTVGSCRRLSTMSVDVAGKTGTAQWATDKPNHAWFTSFAPYENPEIVVTVLLEEGGEGSSVAVPVAQKVLQAWWDMRNSSSVTSQ
ncbi:MAG: penicillin-binding protein 2 [Candidatus Nomurabacteria bacterium]|nr:MAG: penicillin-binding protein 2 [Candidatus Nomurabacteria bacterium]